MVAMVRREATGPLNYWSRMISLSFVCTRFAQNAHFTFQHGGLIGAAFHWLIHYFR